MSQAVSHATLPERASTQRLEIDSDRFRACFNQRPFLIGHHLVDHPLFSLPRLIELSQALPEKDVEYNGGQIPINCDPKLTPKNGLGIDETIRRIEECKSWMVLKYVENDPAYRALLLECLEEVKVHSEAIYPGMCGPEGFVFISSPGSVTPYHMDPEHNFLLQIHGDKTVALFNGRDRELVGEEELERFHSNVQRNMVFREEFQAKANLFDLRPGQGLHFPVAFPHYVKVGATYSISFSITFRTPDLERRGIVYKVNGQLRQRGYRPTPVGQSPWRDALKYQAYRVWRRTRRLLGKPIEE